MHSSVRQESPARAVTVRAHRLGAALLGVVVLPLTLSACGLIGGNDDAQAPVVIPSEAPAETSSGTDPAADPGASPTTPTDPGTVSADGAALPPAPQTVNNTVTKTGIIVQNRTKTQTKTATATKTLPPNTVTAPPITLTETRTETRTDTRTVTVAGPATTVTVRVTCAGVPVVCA